MLSIGKCGDQIGGLGLKVLAWEGSLVHTVMLVYFPGMTGVLERAVMPWNEGLQIC